MRAVFLVAAWLLAPAPSALANDEQFMAFIPYTVLCTIQEPERYVRTSKEIDFYEDLQRSSKGIDFACVQRAKPASRAMCDAVMNPELTKDPKAIEHFQSAHFEDVRRASIFASCGWPRLWKDPKFDKPSREPITPR